MNDIYDIMYEVRWLSTGLVTRPPPLLEFWPRTGAEGGEGPARARMENRDRFNVMYYPTWCSLKKIAPMGNRFFEFI